MPVLKCPFCGAELELVGRVSELAESVKLPLVGSPTKFLPKELAESEIYKCPKCGFVALFHRG